MRRSLFARHHVSVVRLGEQRQAEGQNGAKQSDRGWPLVSHSANVRARIAQQMAAQLAPTNMPTQNDTRAQQRILEDIFMHASAHSRTCESISRQVQQLLRLRDAEDPGRAALDPRQIAELSDGIGRLEMAVRDLCARIAPGAVERARLLANVYPDPDQQLIFDLEGERLDTFLGPIFAEAGIGSDLLCEAELQGVRRVAQDLPMPAMRG